MPITADCLNTKTENGRNLAPELIIPAAQRVLGGIDLDPASDLVANKIIQADRIFSFETDGLQQDWTARSVWLNPPGQTITGGTLQERDYWRAQLKLPKEVRGKKPDGVSSVTASRWAEKLYVAWIKGYVENAIYLAYRGGSIGSLGIDFISDALTCITASGAESPSVNGSGRLSYDRVENGKRFSETSNTQNSGIFLLAHDEDIRARFKKEFSAFGVVMEVAR